MATEIGNVTLGMDAGIPSVVGGGAGGGSSGFFPFQPVIGGGGGGGKPMWMVTRVEYDLNSHKLVQHRVKVRAVLYEGGENVADVPPGAVVEDVFVAKPVTTCGGSES